MHPPPADATAPESLGPGTLLAERFRIEHFAARGGMSAVYRATDLGTGAPVAIKVLAHEEPGGDDRLATEIDVLAGLSHPAIVRYVAHGQTAARRAFLAMEWLTGEDLASRLAREGLRVSESLALLSTLCGGLALAHARGIVHRDIKPSNVFLVDGEVSRVKLIDFGVARHEASTRTLTKAGALLGTVGYMAPEQARGALDLDARADVFALGCLLFECLTGTPAFAGAHEIAVLAKVLRDEPPTLSGLRPELVGLDGLLARLLAKDRAARPADAEAVLAQLREVYQGATLSDAPAGVLVRPRARDAEQRIASVILGAPDGAVPPEAPGDAVAKIDALARAFGAEASAMQGGGLLLGLTGASSSAPTDQAVRAVRCALRLAAMLPTLSVGVATGTVDTSGAVPVGQAIDRAAGLVSEPGRAVRIDALTADLLGARFLVQRDASGLVVLGERDEGDDADVLMGKSTPFVGRSKEMALLSATLHECVDDQVARGILLTAPAGAGKSRVGREFLERARAEGARVLRAGADPTSAGSTLSLVQRLLRNAVGARDGEPSAAQRDRLEAALRPHSDAPTRAQTFDFLCEILDVAPSVPERALHRAARGDPEVMREQKRRAFEQWMSWEAERGPLLLFLEDLHWGDLPSVTYVQELMQSLSGRALFVLATARPEVHAQFPRLREAGTFDELVLRGLTRRASEQLVRAMLPLATEEAVLSKVVELASGNAFYLGELVRRVAEGAGSELPETVVAMAQSRLERLPAEARRVLRAASVFGETTWVGGVAQLLAASPDEAAHAGSQLAWLCEQEILQPRGEPRFPGEREFVFRHALLREAAYVMLTDADRQRAHLAAAEWLTARGERDARVMADHFERGGACARALPWIVKGAMGALDGGDPESAIALAQRGLGLEVHGEPRGMLLLVRAYASVWGARRDFELPREALSLLPRASAPWWLALSIHVFGSSLLGQPDLADPYLEIALTTSPGGELSAAYGQAIQTLAAGSALVGRTAIGWALVRHCEQDPDGETLLDPAFLAWLNLTKCILGGNALDDRGRWALGDAITCGHASVQAMRVLGSQLGEAAALFHLGSALWLAGGYAQASGVLQESLSVAKQTGYLLVEQHASLLLAVGALRGGARADAEALLHRLARSHNSQTAHGAETVLADACFREGRGDEALVRARACAAGPSLLYRRMAQSILARIHLAKGEVDAALEAVARGFADGGGSAFPHLTLDLLCSRARAEASRGAPEAAASAVAAALKLRDETAASLEDPALRRAFVSRGPANKLLDGLAGGVVSPPTA